MIGILCSRAVSGTYNLVESVLRLSPIGWNLKSTLNPPHSDTLTPVTNTNDLFPTFAFTIGLRKTYKTREKKNNLDSLYYAATTDTSACSRLGTKQQDATGREMGGHALDQGTE